LEYFLDCSRDSLKTFVLRKLEQSSNSRKQARKFLDEWVADEAMALLAEWFEVYGEKLVALAAARPEAPIEEVGLTAASLEVKQEVKTEEELCRTDVPHKLMKAPASADKHRQSPFRPPHRIYRKIEKAG